MSPVEDDELDLTRKERREQARTDRKKLEDTQRAQAARRRRLIQLGSVAGVVVLVVVGIAIAAGGGGTAKKLKTTETGSSVPHAAEVTTLLNGIPQSGIALGSPTATVTLQEYADLQCPFCRDFTLQSLPTLINNYVRTGKLRIEFHNFNIIGPDSIKASKMAEAAGLQNRLWNFVELFYHNQQQENTGYVTDSFVSQVGGGVKGLNVTKALSARSLDSVTNKITKDNELARQYATQYANVQGFTGTPSFLISKTGQPPTIFSPTSLGDPAPFEDSINKLL
ncbi:MAG TPA: thioredoxin domain-containing protein [Solirubrobacteraceae bacterium]|nr:thioredoxin domain-containing protein [Solirubrobacteraceae bacterium]